MSSELGNEELSFKGEHSKFNRPHNKGADSRDWNLSNPYLIEYEVINDCKRDHFLNNQKVIYHINQSAF